MNVPFKFKLVCYCTIEPINLLFYNALLPSQSNMAYALSFFQSTGCLNGGGQIKRKPGQSPKDFIQSLETAYMDDVCFGWCAMA